MASTIARLNMMEKENHKQRSEKRESERTYRLQQKLRFLGYEHRIVPENASVIEELMGDLVQATENLNAIKEQVKVKVDEAVLWQAEVDPLRKENQRLISENNKLHVQLIREAEHQKEALYTAKAEAKRCLDENKDLRFIASQYQHRLRALEQENEKMKKRTEEVLEKTTSVRILAGKEVKKLPINKQGIEQSAPLAPSGILPQTSVVSSPLPSFDGPSDGAAHDGDARVEELSKRAKKMQEELEALRTKAQLAGESLDARDSEISRLSAELAKGTNTEAARLAIRCEDQEQKITDLRQQLDYVYTQMADFESDMASKDDAESRAKRAESDKRVLVEKVTKERKRNEELCTELKELQGRVNRLRKQEKVRDAAAGVDVLRQRLTQIEKDLKNMTADRDEILQENHDLHARLAGRKPSTRAPKRSGTVDRGVSTGSSKADPSATDKAVGSRRKRERDELRGEASEEQPSSEEVAQLHTELGSIKMERNALQGRISQAGADTARLQSELEAMLSDQRAYGDTIRELNARHGRDQSTISNIRSELGGVKAAMRRHETDAKAAMERCQVLQHDNERLTEQWRNLNKEMEQLQSEKTNERKPAAGAGPSEMGVSRRTVRALEDERDFLKREVEKLQDALRHERGRAIELEGSAATLNVELATLQGELEVTRSEQQKTLTELRGKEETLQDLASQKGKLESDVGSMANLRARVIQMQEEIQSRVSEAATANAKTERLMQTINKAELDIQRLQDDKTALHTVIDDNKLERERLAAIIERLENRAFEAEENAKAVKADNLQASHLLEGTNKDLVQQAEAERKARLENEQLSSELRMKSQQAERLERSLKSAQGDIEGLEVVVADLRAQVGSHREEATQAVDKESRAAEKARTAATEADALKIELRSCLDANDSVKDRLRAIQEERDRLRSDNEDLKAYVTQLRSMTAQLERGREQEAASRLDAEKEMEKLRSEVSGLVEQRERLNEQLQNSTAVMTGLRQTIAQLDRDKDLLQDEVDTKTEVLAQTASRSSEADATSHRSAVALDAATQQLELHLDQLAAKDRQIAELEAHLQNAAQLQEQLRGEIQTHKQQVEGLANDLAKLTAENQAANRDLAHVSNERDTIAQELQQYVQRVLYIEELAKDKEREKMELLSSYNALGQDHHRLSTQHQQSDSDRVQLEVAVRQMGAEMSQLGARVAESEATNQRYTHDLSALERHTEMLSRSLRKAQEELQMYKSQSAAVEGDLKTVQQIQSGTEQDRQALSLRYAELATQNDLLRQDIDGKKQENQEIVEQLTAERRRVEQMERLLLEERERQARSRTTASQHESIASESKQSVQALRLEIEKLRQHADKLESDARTSAEARAEMAGVAVKLREELASARAKVSELPQAAVSKPPLSPARKATRGSSLKPEQDSVIVDKDRLIALESTVQQQYSAIQVLDSERTQLKNFVTRYERELDSAETRLADLRNQYKGREEHNLRFEEEYSTKSKELESLKQQVNLWKQDYKALRKTVKSLPKPGAKTPTSKLSSRITAPEESPLSVGSSSLSSTSSSANSSAAVELPSDSSESSVSASASASSPSSSSSSGSSSLSSSQSSA